jgi:dethiobiotin synthetase
MKQRYFITGTDTSIGKTLISNGLLQLANQDGLKTLGLKPVAAGCEQIDGQWMNADARELMLSSSVQPDYSTVNPVALREAVAPHIAAAQEGVTVRARELAKRCRESMADAEFTVIEGAGGWQVPLNDSETMADLAQAIGAPVILVVGMRLGCINHALLSANAIRSTGLKLAGWVANHVDTAMAAQNRNVASLEQRLNAPLLGRIPTLSNVIDVAQHLRLP